MNNVGEMVEEIKCSRALAREIFQVTQQYGAGIVPKNVYDAYIKLQLVYQKQMEREGI